MRSSGRGEQAVQGTNVRPSKAYVVTVATVNFTAPSEHFHLTVDLFLSIGVRWCVNLLGSTIGTRFITIKSF